MFTGIITDLGSVVDVVGTTDRRLVIATAYDMTAIPIGASIACNGICLTVVDKADGRFAVEASAETIAKTTLGSWMSGTRVNLERPLRIGDELGGHIVSGHVDGVARVIAMRPDGDSLRFQFAPPADLARFIAPKGSVTLDGVSLTVNEVEDGGAEGTLFGVNVIPHTRTVTSFGGMRPGHSVNMEIDMLARYVARLLARA